MLAGPARDDVDAPNRKAVMDEHQGIPLGGIAVVETAGATVARLWGEIDEALREQASAALSKALERDLPVVLDAGEVSFIDSTGIAFLVQFCRVGHEEGLSVTLRNPPDIVQDVLDLLGMTHLFDAVEVDGVSTPGGRRPLGEAGAAPRRWDPVG